ncbi:MAG: peptidoglycan editing factor PgeF [Betaproteobacteria bacterium]|nr:peptidoglycan editing factor PgeF [Betaproteobacteria bacterium]
MPEWDAPRQVEAWFTTRGGGVSHGPYASMNLGLHVGDSPEAVAENRRLALLAVPDKPVWLNQVHGNAVVCLDALPATTPAADAAIATRGGLVCTVLVADCLPVFLCDRDGTTVGVAHAGWRGLAAGVLEASIRAIALPTERVIAYLGPAIGANAFEVGAEVREAFITADEGAHEAFRPIAGRPEKYWCDLNQLARRRLRAVGVHDISGGAHCTYSRPDRFFSFRRDGVTGRMGAFIRLRG